MTDISKSNLRKSAKEVRAAAHQMQGYMAAEQAANHAMKLISPLAKSNIIALYWPMGDELDTRFLQNALERAGYRTALPVVVAKDTPLIFRLWGQGDPLVSAAFGTHVPEDDAPEVEPHVVITPLLAFDKNCYRMGYGGGFYDRTFARDPNIQAFGFAYAAQYVDDMPVDDHDWPMHGVITETGLILPKE